MKKAPNPKAYFMLAGAAVIGGMGFLYMQNSSLEAVRSKVEQLREQSEEQRKIKAKLDDSKKSLEALKTQLGHLEEGVPDAAYVPTMLKELEMAGKKQGIEITGVRPIITANSAIAQKDADKDPKPYQQLDLELKGKGKYDNVVAFIRSLNVFPKIVATRTVNISPVSKGTPTTDRTLELTVNLRAFLFKQSVPPPTKKPNGGAA